MAQQSIGINLSFTADTGKAKREIEGLISTLRNLGSVKGVDPTQKLTPQILEAQKAAVQLSIALQNATNVNTGKLNLTQFETQLQRSGKSLKDYRIQLEQLGPAGIKSFGDMATQIIKADATIKTSSKLLNDMWVTLKNTAKWEFSSSALKAFTGAFSTAFDYAQDLNKSLNDIRIVSGQSAEQMASFAVQANKAAKELSVSTTDYTNASLIFYQQGAGRIYYLGSQK